MSGSTAKNIDETGTKSGKDLIFAGSPASRFLITPLHAGIMELIHTNGDLSVTAISKELNETERKIRSALTGLIASGIIRKRASISIFALGCRVVDLFVSWTARGFSNRDNTISWLKKHPSVNFVSELGGSYHLRIGLIVRSPLQQGETVEAIISHLGESVDRYVGVEVCEIAEYPLSWLPGGPKPKAIRYTRQNPRATDLDELDYRILEEMSEIEERTIPDASRAVGISISTFDYRLSRLKREGILVGTRYIIDASRLGFLHVNYFLQFRRLGTSERERLHTFCSRHPRIYALESLFGFWNIELDVVFSKVGDMTEFSESLYREFGELISEITALPVLRCHRYTDFPRGYRPFNTTF
jgi:DNA-binding Lrp family transcriptional regulator